MRSPRVPPRLRRGRVTRPPSSLVAGHPLYPAWAAASDFCMPSLIAVRARIAPFAIRIWGAGMARSIGPLRFFDHFEPS